MSMFEYDNGILVCKEHRTPIQKNENGLWCCECDVDDAEYAKEFPRRQAEDT